MNANIDSCLWLRRLAVVAALLGGAPARADVVTWSCTDDFWHADYCWDFGTVPTLTDDVIAGPVNGTNTFLRFDSSTGVQSVNSLLIDSSTSETIDFVQTGGNLSIATSESIGSTGTGSFTQSGGTNSVGSLGVGSGGSGTYNLSGSGDLAAGVEGIGSYGTGSFIQSGGTHAVSTFISLGDGPTGNGSYNLSSGSLTADSEYIGTTGGTGVFTQSGGVHTVTNSLYLGIFVDIFGSSGNGTYNLSSTGSLTAANEYIGLNGIGVFNQSGGTHIVNNLQIGSSPGGSGTYNLSGSGSLTAAFESIGFFGTGSFTQSGGTNTVSNGLYLGYESTGNGTYNLSGTGSLTAGDEYIGFSGTGVFNQSGGTHTVDTMTLAANAGSTGTYNLTGGTLTVNNGITNNAGGVFNTGAGTIVTVGGPGFINHGQLNGPGTIAGNITSDGTIAPGNSPGTLAIAGDYTQSALGTLAVEIGGLLAGTEYDVLNVTGTATLDGTLDVSLFDLGSGLFAPQAGDSFDILTADLLQGSFSTLSFAALLDPNLSWQINYLIDAIGTTDVVRLSVVNAVPIPPAVWLFGSGLLGLIGVARRKTCTA